MEKLATREAYGKALAELIVENQNIVVLDADLTKSTKTIDAKLACPSRHFNMGIAEGNMMSVAAGMAASKFIPYVSSFAMFAAGRGFEQIRNSIAYSQLNVKICATHAGLTVGEDGATHQSIEDISLMRGIPGMHVFQPCDAVQTEFIIKAIAELDGPCYVRLGRNKVEPVYKDVTTCTLGKGTVLHVGKDVALIASGLMVQEALAAKDQLIAQGIDPTVVDIHCIKPIDEALIKELAKSHRLLVTCEEHSVIGGLGSAVAEVVVRYHPCHMEMIGVNDTFGESGTPTALLAKYGLDAQAIVEKVKSYLL